MRNRGWIKRIVLVTVIALLSIGLAACSSAKSSTNNGSLSNVASSNTAQLQKFYDKVFQAQEMLDVVADAIYSNWYDAIYNDEFGESIDLAIASAMVDYADDLDSIEKLDAEIADLYKTVRDTKLSAEVKEVMTAYSDYYELVVNVSGSFKSYSADKEVMKKTLSSALKTLSFEL